MANKFKNHVWDLARNRTLVRRSPLGETQALDPGVNYFVEALERLGAKTEFSCEGHPAGFYVLFRCGYALAQRIKCGFFAVELEGKDRWSIRFSLRHKSERDKVRTLRWASAHWENTFFSGAVRPRASPSRVLT